MLAQMSSILGNLRISIASVIQKEADPSEGTAELVITTHPSLERDVQQALHELEKLEVGEGDRQPPANGGVNSTQGSVDT